MASETITGIPNRSEVAGNGFKKAEAEATQAAKPAALDDAIARIVDKLARRPASRRHSASRSRTAT